MRQAVENLIRAALQRLDDLPDEAIPEGLGVERARDSRHGDFATNIALVLAKPARCNPRELATRILGALGDSPLIERTEIAGPGFINFFLSRAAWADEIGIVLDAGDGYGKSGVGAGRPVMVEFVSANPTGPLHVGHGRHAAYGATVANLLAATGHAVRREYYVNDAGRQIDILATSLWLRYLAAGDVEVPFPCKGYRGDYLGDIAATLRERHADTLMTTADCIVAGLPADGEEQDGETHIDALIARARELLGPQNYRVVADTALEAVLADIRDDLAGFGVEIDEWFSERRLVESDAVGRALAHLRDNGDLFEKDGATWFRSSRYGDEKDRVIVRENGQTTYIASDIAYHSLKRERGADLLLDVLGSDHHGYIARVRAGLEALGHPPESLEVQLVQFVTLYRGGQKMQMSTRSGKFIPLRELREEVGNDAARLFYVSRSNDQHLNFDVDLAKARTEDNPVYYIQYAHARVCSVFRALEEHGYTHDPEQGRAGLANLDETHERALMTELSRFPEIVELSAANRAPHHLVHYLRGLANQFHTYYNAHRFIVEDAAQRNARLTLVVATRQVIRNGLELLGVSAPETM